MLTPVFTTGTNSCGSGDIVHLAIHPGGLRDVRLTPRATRDVPAHSPWRCWLVLRRGDYEAVGTHFNDLQAAAISMRPEL